MRPSQMRPMRLSKLIPVFDLLLTRLSSFYRKLFTQTVLVAMTIYIFTIFGWREFGRNYTSTWFTVIITIIICVGSTGATSAAPHVSCACCWFFFFFVFPSFFFSLVFPLHSQLMPIDFPIVKYHVGISPTFSTHSWLYFVHCAVNGLKRFRIVFWWTDTRAFYTTLRWSSLADSL